MWQPNNEEETLNSLGLTISQAKVYLTLAKHGPLKVAAISQTSRICREHIYGLLKTLEKKGLVEKELDIATVYRAVPLNVTLPLMVKKKQREFTELETRIKTIVESYERERAVTPALPKFKPEICVASNRTRILNKVRGYFEEAKVQIDLAHTWKRFVQFWDYYEDTLLDAMDRGVRVRELVEFPCEVVQADDFLSRKAFSNKMFEMRFVQSLGGNFAFLDNEKMFMSSTRSKGNFAQTPLIFSNCEGFLGVVQKYFQLSWRNCYRWNPNTSIVELMAQLKTEEPD